MKFYFLLLFILGQQAKAFVCEDMLPKNPQTKNNWYFAELILSTEYSSLKKSNQLRMACQPFNFQFNEWKTINNYNEHNSFYSFWFDVYILPDTFTWIGGNEITDRYYAELLEIKNLTSVYQRLQLTYELFLKYKTTYDELYIKKQINSSNRGLWLTPNETLQSKAICRDFARLLNYSFAVTGATSNPSNGWQPVFTSKIRTGYDDLGAHAWVTVKVPILNDSGQLEGFTNIDFDPTNFTKDYVPLMPLAQNLNEDVALDYFNQCQKIISCLEDQTAK